MARWIPFDAVWRTSISRINSGFVCGINSLCTLIVRHQPGQYIIHGNFIMFVCFQKRPRSGIQKSGTNSTEHCYSVLLFWTCASRFTCFSWKQYYLHKIIIKSFFSFAQGFSKCFHTYYIISLGTIPAAYSLLLSGFIRKMWLLFSVCALISSIQGNENALVG